MLGTTFLHSREKFTGFTPVGFGTAVSDINNFLPEHLPFGQIAVRANKNFVVGVSVTEPYFGNINWGPDSIVRFTSTKTTVNSVRVTPKVSFQVTPKLTVGAGLVFTRFYNFAVNFSTPLTGNIVNKTTANQVSFVLGLFYVLNPNNYLDIVYFQGRKTVAHGTSTSDSGLSNNNFTLNAIDPTIFYVGLIHKFTPKLLTFGKIFYSHYHAFNELRLGNSVIGNLVFPLRWTNTYSFALGGKYDFTEKWSGTVAGIYETNFPRSNLNSVAYAGSPALGLAAAVANQVTKKLNVQLLYGHYMFVPSSKIQNLATGDFGNLTLNAEYVELKLTYSL